MRPKRELGEELDWLSDKISSRVWTLNLGTLATTWSLLIATGSGERLIRSSNAIPIMLLCILAMLCDLSQYLAGYRYAKSILKRLEDSGEPEFEYNKSEPLYKLRDWLFCCKIALSLTAAIWLVVILAKKFI
jgi:hypothetical protein